MSFCGDIQRGLCRGFFDDAEDAVHALLIVLQEIWQVSAQLDALRMVFDPALESRGNIADGVRAGLRRLFAVEDAPGVFRHLVLGLQHGYRVASAVRMPAHKFEVFGVLALERVADVSQRHSVKRVVVR